MKSKLLLIFVFQVLLWNCKSPSISKQDLIAENKILKERLAQLEAKDTTKIDAVVEVSNMNVVYRGIFNPLKIQVPNAEKVIVSAPGLMKIDDHGHYKIAPTYGNSVDIKIEAEMPNGQRIVRTKPLRIYDIKKGRSLFDGQECYRCNLKLKKAEIKNAKITFNIVDFLYDANFKIVYFKIKFPNLEPMKIEGNIINEKCNNIIDSLKEGDMVQIFDIGLKSDIRYCKVSPIIIEVIAN